MAAVRGYPAEWAPEKKTRGPRSGTARIAAARPQRSNGWDREVKLRPGVRSQVQLGNEREKHLSHLPGEDQQRRMCLFFPASGCGSQRLGSRAAAGVRSPIFRRAVFPDGGRDRHGRK